MSLDLKALRAFDAVAQHRSFLRASVALGVAQSALSRQVSALERGLGARLFHRTGRGVALTALGERFSPRARALLDAAADLEHEARAQGAELSGEVSLGIVPVASRGIVVPLVAAVREKHPRVRLRVLEGYSGQVEEWLADGRVDIGVFNRYRRGRVRGAEPIRRADVHLVARRGHPALRTREVALRALAGIALAMPVRPNSLTDLVTGLAATQHFALDIAFEAGSSALIREAIVSTGLATLSPREVFAEGLEAGALGSARLVRPAIRQVTWLAVGSARPPTVAVREVARLAREIAARA